MPLDRRSLRIIAFRGLALTFTLAIIMVITALILGATGYDEKILEALVGQEIQEYKRSLENARIPPEEIKKLVDERREELVKIYGLDKPWYERSLRLLPKLVTLNLNVTVVDTAAVLGLPWPLTVADAIGVALPRTIVMITIAYIIAALIAVPLGPYVAYKRGSLLDRGVIVYAAVSNAFPVWWVAMIAILVTGFYLGIAPFSYRLAAAHIAQFTDSLFRLDLIEALIALKSILYYSYVPIIVVVFTVLGQWIYSARAVAIRVVSEDYVIAAKAKGLPESMVTRKYVLRVIAGPVLTFIILGLAGSISGYIITESVFDWPGMGLLFYTAITRGDSSTVLALVYVTTLVYIVARFILEVLYVILDPRVKL